MSFERQPTDVHCSQPARDWPIPGGPLDEGFYWPGTLYAVACALAAVCLVVLATLSSSH